jgi:hypothetical protein
MMVDEAKITAMVAYVRSAPAAAHRPWRATGNDVRSGHHCGGRPAAALRR